MSGIRKGEIRKSERFNFACTPETLGLIHLIADASNQTPSEALRSLIQEKYNVLVKSVNVDAIILENLSYIEVKNV